MIETYHAVNAGRTRVPDWAQEKRKDEGTVPLHYQSEGYVLVRQSKSQVGLAVPGFRASQR